MIGKILPTSGRPGAFVRNRPGISPKVPQRAGLAMAVLLATVSCIERSNPFDPINSGEARTHDVRQQLEAGLKARAAGEDVYRANLNRFDSAFQVDSAENARIISDNLDRAAKNKTREAENTAIELANATAPLESLQSKQEYFTLGALSAYGYPDMDRSRRDLRVQTVNLALFISQANAANSPAIIYPPEFSDSVLAPFVRDSTGFAGLQARIDSDNRKVGAYNSEWQANNTALAAANEQISNYNRTIFFRQSIGNHPVYVRADSLDGGIKKALPGDTLFVGEGSFPLDLRFNNSGTGDKPILVRGYPGGRTIIRAPSPTQTVMALSASKYIQFQDIVFRGGRGVRLDSKCENIEFRHCLFDSSSGYGIQVTESSVLLSDCRLTGNAQGAFIQGKTDGSAPVNIVNVLIARNQGTGLALISPTGTIFNSTISDNGGEGVDLSVPHFTFTVFASIITGNSGVGIYRHRDTEYQDKLNVLQSDVWGNKTIDWSLAGLDTVLADSLRGRNYNIPPQFNDPENLDYAPLPGSTFSEWEHQTPALLIGYRP